MFSKNFCQIYLLFAYFYKVKKLSKVILFLYTVYKNQRNVRYFNQSIILNNSYSFDRNFVEYKKFVIKRCDIDIHGYWERYNMYFDIPFTIYNASSLGSIRNYEHSL